MADTPLQVTGNRTKQEETASIVEVLERATKRAVAAVQDYSLLSFRALTNLATAPHYFQDTLDQMDDVGVGSLPIILLSGFFIGGVMVLQTGAQFVRFGQTSLTGDVVSLALVRELGPHARLRRRRRYHPPRAADDVRREEREDAGVRISA